MRSGGRARRRGGDVMSILRYGIVGCGRVFQSYHLPCLLERTDYAIVAACEVDPGQAGTALNILGSEVLVTGDLDDFFSLGRPDVVAVCTPNDAHTEPVLAALAAGAAVLCEKPLAASLDDARQIHNAMTDSAQIGVNLPYRFHDLLPVYRAAVPLVTDAITLTFATAGHRVWRPATRWYDDPRRAGGGALLDLGVHALDVLVALFGWPEVAGCRVDRSGADNRAVVDLVFGCGPVAVHINRASRVMRLDIEIRHGNQVTRLDLRRGEVHHAGRVISASKSRPEFAAINQFLDLAAGRGGELVSVTDALRLQELVAAAYSVSVVDPSAFSGGRPFP